MAPTARGVPAATSHRGRAGSTRPNTPREGGCGGDEADHLAAVRPAVPLLDEVLAPPHGVSTSTGSAALAETRGAIHSLKRQYSPGDLNPRTGSRRAVAAPPRGGIDQAHHPMRASGRRRHLTPMTMTGSWWKSRSKCFPRR